MRDDVAEIDEDPAAVGVAFEAANRTALALRRLDDRIGDRTGLNFRAPANDGKRVGENRASVDVDCDKVLAFLIEGCVADNVDQIADA